VSAGFSDLLRERLAGLAELSPAQAAALEAHYRLLVKWNRVLNLTSIDKVVDVVERHYCESVVAGVELPSGSWTVVDVGSGAGFPGVPIAIMRPECRITLVESHQRKAVFLKEGTRGLANVRVLACRVEAVTEEFDWLVSRAVSYGDLFPRLKKLGRNVELLTGAEPPPAGCGVEWARSKKLPWAKQRYLWFGVGGVS